MEYSVEAFGSILADESLPPHKHVPTGPVVLLWRGRRWSIWVDVRVRRPTIGRTEGHGQNRTLDQQDRLRPHGERTDLKQPWVCLLYPRQWTSQQVRERAHLKFELKLILNPDCHLGLYPVHCQKHVILEIDILRQNREPLEDILRKFWRTSRGRDEPELRRIEGNARLCQTSARELEPPPIKAASSGLKECLGLEVCIVPLADFRQLFPSQLSVLRMQSDHFWSVRGTGTEVHPKSSCDMNEERMNDSARKVCADYSLLLWTCEMDSEQSEPL